MFTFPTWPIRKIGKTLFAVSGEDAKFDEVFIDSTNLRTHQHRATAKKGGAPPVQSGVTAAGLAE